MINVINIKYKLTIFVLFLALIAGCKESNVVPLINGIPSNTDISDIGFLFKKMGGSVSEDKILDKNTELKIFLVREFSHFGHNGELRFGFYKDKLVSAWFYPENWNEYSEVAKFLITKEMSLSPNLSITFESDINNNKFVLWKDKILSKKAEKAVD